MIPPTTDHWVATKQVLCYLKGTISHDLFYTKTRLFISMPSLMLVEQGKRMIGYQSLNTLYFLDTICFHGPP